tara:strand:- start:420 stop:923 length:504 start_codon:yes stop_codon:yes gene_type:complete
MDNTEETFDELWNRNNTLEKEISMFEEEYSFVLEQVKLYTMQEYAKEVEKNGVDINEFAEASRENISDVVELFSEMMKHDNRPPVDRDVVKKQIISMNKELDCRYEEQISVCNKIIKLYEEEKFSTDWSDRNVNVEMFPQYIEVVEKLRATNLTSTQQTLDLLDEAI